MILRESEPSHVTQTMHLGIGSGHDAGVRRQGQRHLHGGVREANAAVGERVQLRRPRYAPGADFIGCRSSTCNLRHAALPVTG